MRSQSALRDPPPMAVSPAIRPPRASSASSPSATANATPSSTANVMAARVVAPVSPKNTPDAAGLLCGVRSPDR